MFTTQKNKPSHRTVIKLLKGKERSSLLCRTVDLMVRTIYEVRTGSPYIGFKKVTLTVECGESGENFHISYRVTLTRYDGQIFNIAMSLYAKNGRWQVTHAIIENPSKDDHIYQVMFATHSREPTTTDFPISLYLYSMYDTGWTFFGKGAGSRQVNLPKEERGLVFGDMIFYCNQRTS